MEYNDKRRWLRKHGTISHVGYCTVGLNISWKPFGHSNDDYYYECRAATMMDAYIQLYEEAKETLYQDCEDISGSS